MELVAPPPRRADEHGHEHMGIRAPCQFGRLGKFPIAILTRLGQGTLKIFYLQGGMCVIKVLRIKLESKEVMSSPCTNKHTDIHIEE